MRRITYLIVSLVVSLSLAACGKPPANSPPGGGSSDPPKDGIVLEKEAEPRCAQVGTITTLKNASLLQATWHQINDLLGRFKAETSRLNTNAETYCNVGGQNDTNYESLTGAYKEAYQLFKKVAVYDLAEFKNQKELLTAPVPLNIADIDAFLKTSPLPDGTKVKNAKKTYDKVIGFPVVDYLIFHEKEHLDQNDSRCAALILNTKVIKQAATDLQAEWTVRVTALEAPMLSKHDAEVGKKHLLVDIILRMSQAPQDLSSHLKEVLQAPTEENIKKFDAAYGKLSLSGLKAELESIRQVYRGRVDNKINYEKRYCLQDQVDSNAGTNLEQLNDYYLNKGRAQKIHDQFRYLDLLITAIQKDATTLEDAYLKSKTDKQLKDKLESLAKRLNQLGKGIYDYSLAVNLTHERADNDGD